MEFSLEISWYHRLRLTWLALLLFFLFNSLIRRWNSFILRRLFHTSEKEGKQLNLYVPNVSICCYQEQRFVLAFFHYENWGRLALELIAKTSPHRKNCQKKRSHCGIKNVQSLMGFCSKFNRNKKRKKREKIFRAIKHRRRKSRNVDRESLMNFASFTGIECQFSFVCFWAFKRLSIRFVKFHKQWLKLSVECWSCGRLLSKHERGNDRGWCHMCWETWKHESFLTFSLFL